MQGRVCDRWATQTTAKDIAQQNSEVTVSWGGGRGRQVWLHSWLRVWPASERTGEAQFPTFRVNLLFVLAQTKMSWRSLLTSQYSR